MTHDEALSPRIAEIVRQVTTARDGLSTVFGAHHLHFSADSGAELRDKVAGAMYDVLHVGRQPSARPGERTTADPRFEQRLAAAVPHTRTRAEAMVVRTFPGMGEVHVELEGVRVRVTADDPGPTPGQVTELEFGCARRRLSPGFFVVDGSAGHGLVPRSIVRIYVHITNADHAPGLWGRALACLERLSVPYRAKIASARSSFPRHDALTIYLGPTAWSATRPIADALALSTGLGVLVSPFTYQLAPGVSMAWDPDDERPGYAGLSFGEHRSRALADGLLDGGTTAARLPALIESLLAANIDPKRPFRNINSPEIGG